MKVRPLLDGSSFHRGDPILNRLKFSEIRFGLGENFLKTDYAKAP